MKRFGIDVGSRYIGCVQMDKQHIVNHHYIEHKGNVSEILKKIMTAPELQDIDISGVTGNLSTITDGGIDNALAFIEGAKFLLPHCRNVFVVGGETFSLIFLDENGNYKEHSINPPCAAGTGSFVEQQAERLQISVPELSQKALAFAESPPTIATRCAVFAKTDIIHAMQEGHSLEAICAGLCEGIARNIVDSMVKGRRLTEPIGIIGGVSLNRKIVSEVERLIGKSVLVPEHASVAGAIGAAILGSDTGIDPSIIERTRHSQRTVRPPLSLKKSRYPDFNAFDIETWEGIEIMRPREPQILTNGIFMGIDIGSTSTKIIVINTEKEIAGGFYTATKGNPILAVQNLLKALARTFPIDELPIKGVGTTGSGRKMIKSLFNADGEVDEITAHAKAAIHLAPKVDTIIEIGGQDAKFTRIRDNDVYFSVMNYVCAAGTGSFIEEQSKRLGITLSNFSDLAMQSEAPFTSDRCTVYMEKDLNLLLSEGWPKPSIAAAILHSVRDNYLAKVVNKSPLGDYIVFQGATARNKALVAAFEQKLAKPIHVSPFCHLTGALGIALILKDLGVSDSKFSLSLQDLTIEDEVCTYCVNHCLLTVAQKGGHKTAWGMKCGKEYGEKHVKKRSTSQMEKRWHQAFAPLLSPPKAVSPRHTIRIGIPNALYQTAYEPLWQNFLNRLGVSVTRVHPTKKSIQQGKNIVNSDFCAPMVISHGLFQECIKKDVDFLFFPALQNAKTSSAASPQLFREKTTDTYFCYYSQYLPNIVDQLTTLPLKDKLLSPLLYLNTMNTKEIADALYREMARAIPDLTLQEVEESFSAAYQSFERLVATNKTVYPTLTKSAPPSPDKIQVALMGRPYVVFDPHLNLNIAHKLEEMGASVFWQDEFDLEDFELSYANQYYERMHWYFGQKLIKLAEYCAQTPNLFCVYLTCFRCSPDSFLISYLKDIMAYYHKPFLILQLDEHASDVGYTTRIEAGMRSFATYLKRQSATPLPSNLVKARNDTLIQGDTVLIPHMDDLISQFNADCFTKAGYPALLLDSSQQALNTGYQYVSGGECMPLVEIIGSVIEKVKAEHLNPATTFLYLPTTCIGCNFPQFPILADLAFKSAGLNGLKIGLINTLKPSAVISPRLSGKILETNIVGSLLYKMYHRIKPYEKEPGITDRTLAKSKAVIQETLLSGRELRTPLKEIVSLFNAIDRDTSVPRKPRIGLLGDVYVKYNDIMNQRIQDVLYDLGAELIVPSLTEYPFHFFDVDHRLLGDNPKPYQVLRKIEARYEKIAESIIGDQEEPDFATCAQLIHEFNIKHYIPGETSISLGRALYFIQNKLVDAMIHINPIFCCPGVVSASIFRKIQEDYQIPIIDVFYEGSGNPNKILVPHIHYLREKVK